MLISTGRVFRFAFQNIFRNVWLSVATVSIIVLSLLSINTFLLANAFIDTSLKAVEKKVNITVYFKASGQEADFQKLADRMRGMPEVASVDYISKEVALQNLQTKYQKEGNTLIQDALKELDGNPLTASLVIHANAVEGYPAIQQTLAETQYDTLIEKKQFDDRTTLIAKIQIIKREMQNIGWYINIFFAVVATLIVYNTIRITIYSRRREFGIMKLVGATNWFIRAPLLLEGIWYSVIGVGITILIMFPVLGFLQPYTNAFFDGQAFDVLGYFSSHFWTIFGYEFLASVVLNVLGTGLAMGRYLRV